MKRNAYIWPTVCAPAWANLGGMRNGGSHIDRCAYVNIPHPTSHNGSHRDGRTLRTMMLAKSVLGFPLVSVGGELERRWTAHDTEGNVVDGSHVRVLVGFDMEVLFHSRDIGVR